jgi:hypothetical protein
LIKVNHFAAKTISSHVGTDTELLLIEMTVFFSSLTFAYLGYKANIALLLIPNIVLAIASFFLVIFSIYSIISSIMLAMFYDGQLTCEEESCMDIVTK